MRSHYISEQVNKNLLNCEGYAIIDTRTLHRTGAGLKLSKMTGVSDNFENFNIGLDGTGAGLDFESDGLEWGRNPVPCRC